jgi:conserved hypothetical protein
MKKQQSKINILILIGITCLVLYFSLKDDFSNIIDQIVSINIWWLLLAFIMVISYWLLRSKAINVFTRKFQKNTKYSSSLQLMIRTQFFNAVTPFATGGQPYQVYHLVKDGISVSTSTSIIIQNFIVYQIAIVLLGGTAIIANQAFSLFAKSVLLGRLVTLGFIINTSVIIVLFLVAFNKKWNKKLVKFGINILSKFKLVKDKEKKQANWDEYINNFHGSAQVLLENKWDFIKTIIYNILALSMLYSIPLVLLYATGDFTSFNLMLAIATSSYVMLIGSFVPIPGGSGGLEYGFISFYGNFITGSKLTAIMLLWRFVTYYFGMIVGAIALNMKKVKS